MVNGICGGASVADLVPHTVLGRPSCKVLYLSSEWLCLSGQQSTVIGQERDCF